MGREIKEEGDKEAWWWLLTLSCHVSHFLRRPLWLLTRLSGNSGGLQIRHERQKVGSGGSPHAGGEQATLNRLCRWFYAALAYLKILLSTGCLHSCFAWLHPPFLPGRQMGLRSPWDPVLRASCSPPMRFSLWLSLWNCRGFVSLQSAPHNFLPKIPNTV